MPASAKVLVALPLQVDAAGLAAAADASADPSNAAYRHFRTVGSIASTYGASASTVTDDTDQLAHDGLDLRLDPTGGAFWGLVTAAQVQQEFGTQLIERDGLYQPAGQPQVPKGLTGVTGVVGLTATGPASSTAGSGSTAAPTLSPPACPTSTIPSRSSLAQLYGFTHTLAAGDNGAGTSIDIVATSPLQSAVLTMYDHCTGASLSAAGISDTAVPGLSTSDGAGGGDGAEVALDSLVITLLAPQAHLGVVQFDAAQSLSFPMLQLLSQSSTTPDLLDITTVYCETQIGSADRGLSEWLLAALAATGTTTVAAAGDTGSSGCHPQSDSPAVTFPASSAFVASTGGADYQGSADDPQDLRVWDEQGLAGGGGGTSASIGPPPWQTGTKRRVPDVSAYAVPGGVGQVPACSAPTTCQWEGAGGTSLTATVLGAAGVLLAQEHGQGTTPARWGNLAGLLWRTLSGPSGAPALRDITTGANTTFTGSCCAATTGYDTASGWGLFDPDALRAALAGQ